MKKHIASMVLMVIALLALSACKYTTTPSPEFFEAKLILRPGIDDLGSVTVKDFVDMLARIRKPNGKPAELLAWERTDNGYILTSKIADELEIEFEWMKAEKMALLVGTEFDGETIDGLQLYTVVASAPKVKTTEPISSSGASVAAQASGAKDIVPARSSTTDDVSTAKTSATRSLTSVTLQSLECGDTCQLQYADSSGQSQRAVCLDSNMCSKWEKDSKSFVPLIGAKANLVIGSIFIPEGGVTMDSVVEVKILEATEPSIPTQLTNQRGQ